MFCPSDRQLSAIERMEHIVHQRHKQRDFISQEAFQVYFHTLSRRCERLVQQSPEERVRQRERQRQAQQHFYQQPNNLLSYAKKYYFRYFPSTAKLAQQLALKCAKPEIVSGVMVEMTPLFTERENACSVGRRLQSQGRNAQAIRQNLRKRLFTQDTINDVLALLGNDQGSLLDPEAIRRKVHQLRKKGQSRHRIMQTLSGGTEDKTVIQSALAAYDGAQNADDDADKEAVKTLVNKFKRQGIEDDHIIRRLQRRGFHYALIQEVLRHSP